MTIKKLFAHYEDFVSQIISQWRSEVHKARSLGDSYTKSLVNLATQQETSERYNFHKISGINPESVEEEILRCFETHDQNIRWLKNFLTKNLSLSKIEPIYMTYQGHDWYTNVFDKSWAFVNQRRTLEGQERFSQDFFEYPRLIKMEKVEYLWLYQNVVYGYRGDYFLEEQKLLVLDYADKERRKFEKLKRRFSGKETDEIKYERTRIPEEVRIAVWRRDQGKCARCGNRESLEYDHIVPVSKGGGNTVRNIELLCQDCNRSKGNRIE